MRKNRVEIIPNDHWPEMLRLVGDQITPTSASNRKDRAATIARGGGTAPEEMKRLRLNARRRSSGRSSTDRPEFTRNCVRDGWPLYRLPHAGCCVRFGEIMLRWWLALMALLVVCAGVPNGLHRGGGFELERY